MSANIRQNGSFDRSIFWQIINSIVISDHHGKVRIFAYSPVAFSDRYNNFPYHYFGACSFNSHNDDFIHPDYYRHVVSAEGNRHANHAA